MSLASPRRIIIAGGTGYLGMILGRHFHEQGHAVASISRFPKPHPWQAIHWDAKNMGEWASSIDGADVVVNLAGHSIRCRFNKLNQEQILNSRVWTTELIAEAINQCSRPPAVWLNASSANIYPHSLDRDMYEDSEKRSAAIAAYPKKWQFLMDVAEAWEKAAWSAPTPNTRRVLMRIAPVMSPDAGSSFDRLLRLVRWGLGGEIGDGEQYVSWIHDFDFVRAVEFLIDNFDNEGPVNITAPQPMPNHEFMCNLRRAWCTSYFGLRSPKWLVEAACFALRIESELLLKSRRVFPKRLCESGFAFHFPKWRVAAENLVERWRQLSSDEPRSSSI